jgi:hypothetical protein
MKARQMKKRRTTRIHTTTKDQVVGDGHWQRTMGFCIILPSSHGFIWSALHSCHCPDFHPVKDSQPRLGKSEALSMQKLDVAGILANCYTDFSLGYTCA